MFARLKRVVAPSAEHPGLVPADAVLAWAGKQGFDYASAGKDQGLVLSGKILGKPWKLESGASSRDYIRGQELRARAELDVDGDRSVLIMSRPLKETLEQQAYAIYTDTLQTTADPSLPEEMRWLAMYEEFGWRSLAPEFWERYTVLADQRDHALAWIDCKLAELLLQWPQPGVSAKTPFILMLLRGKAYLRMQYCPDDMATLQHAAVIFTSACEAALAGAKPDISL